MITKVNFYRTEEKEIKILPKINQIIAIIKQVPNEETAHMGRDVILRIKKALLLDKYERKDH